MSLVKPTLLKNNVTVPKVQSSRLNLGSDRFTRGTPLVYQGRAPLEVKAASEARPKGAL